MVNRRLLILFILVLITSCTSVQKSELNEAENLKSKKYISLVNGINKSAPDTISSSFTADGNNGEKKFRVEGKVAFDKRGYYKITITDFVFKSPVVEAYRELDVLYFYYPSEKQLLIDDVKKIDLSSYIGFKTDYKMIYTLFTGGIPLLDKYKIHKILYNEKEKGYYLIVENDDYFENIFFRDDVPEKILFIHKLSRDKAEIYLKSVIKKDKSIFFKGYKIVIPAANTGINISFAKPVLNSAVTIDKLNREKLPRKTGIMKIN